MLRKLLHTALTPPVRVLIPLGVFGALATALCVTGTRPGGPVASVIYIVTTYALVSAIYQGMTLARDVRARLERIEPVRRYLNDANYHAEVSLRMSFCINLLFASYKGLMGWVLHSAVMGALAAYYLTLCCIRLYLMRRSQRGTCSDAAARRAYRFSGAWLLGLTLPVGVICLHVVYAGYAPRYPGHLIYATAAFSFYSIINAVIRVLRVRKQPNALYAANSVLALATAMVSIYFLQTAMIHTFGTGSFFDNVMNAVTGGVVFIAIALMALRMLVYGWRQSAA